MRCSTVVLLGAFGSTVSASLIARQIPSCFASCNSQANHDDCEFTGNLLNNCLCRSLVFVNAWDQCIGQTCQGVGEISAAQEAIVQGCAAVGVTLATAPLSNSVATSTTPSVSNTITVVTIPTEPITITQSVTITSSPRPSATSGYDRTEEVAAIVGGTVGSVLGTIVIALLVRFFLRRQKRKRLVWAGTLDEDASKEHDTSEMSNPDMGSQSYTLQSSVPTTSLTSSPTPYAVGPNSLTTLAAAVMTFPGPSSQPSPGHLEAPGGSHIAGAGAHKAEENRSELPPAYAD